MARVSFCMSSRPRKPVRSLCESTCAVDASILISRASFDISSEKTPTTLPSCTAEFSAIFMANEVLPIEGRAAMMTRSDGCRPLVILSSLV